MSVLCPECKSNSVAQIQMQHIFKFINGEDKIGWGVQVELPRNIKLNYLCTRCGYGWYASYTARARAVNHLGCLAVDYGKTKVDRSAAKGANRASQVHKAQGS